MEKNFNEYENSRRLYPCSSVSIRGKIIFNSITTNMKPSITKLLVPITAAALVAGCASSGVKNPSGVPVTHMSADEQGFVAGTGVESQDLVAVTDKMARSVLTIPQIANAMSPP